MTLRHSNHTATLLLDGTVLIVGGEADPNRRDPTADVELFNPATEQWTLLDPMPQPVANHTATLLSDGRVLIAGGGRSGPSGNATGADVTAAAWLYDPAARSFSAASPMNSPRSHHAAVRLRDGRVLVVAGATTTPQPATFGNDLATAEIYDPAANNWTKAGSIREARDTLTAIGLADGRVLTLGGLGASRRVSRVDAFDPDQGSWSMAASDFPSGSRVYLLATVLPSGLVLAGGGLGLNESLEFRSDFYLWDPAGPGSWTPAGDVGIGRTGAFMAQFPSGHVLVAGGYIHATSRIVETDDTRIYDVATGTWSVGPKLSQARSGSTATTLADGRVLICGGNVQRDDLSTCEISVHE